MDNLDPRIFSFFEDDEFINWVRNPDEASSAYWQEWLIKNPGRYNDLQNAREIALGLIEAQKPLNTEAISRDIWEKINAGISTPIATIRDYQTRSIRRNFLYAASFAGFMILSALAYYLFRLQHKTTMADKPQVASVIINNELEHSNLTAQSRVVYLVDGSKVTLRPGSSIKHAVFLQKDKREIYLDGDAFFEVAKDPARPFYVYAHDIVLRVLGTSFNVSTNRANGNITVLVRTGKVSVYKKTNTGKPEFILTPNEGVRYIAQTQSVTKSETSGDFVKANSKPMATDISFNFEEAPVAKIFATLEEAYGIKINFDERIFSKCIINTSLNDETFEEKLKIICEALSAKYRIEKNQVYVDGTACK